MDLYYCKEDKYLEQWVKLICILVQEPDSMNQTVGLQYKSQHHWDGTQLDINVVKKKGESSAAINRIWII